MFRVHLRLSTNDKSFFLLSRPTVHFSERHVLPFLAARGARTSTIPQPTLHDPTPRLLRRKDLYAILHPFSIRPSTTQPLDYCVRKTFTPSCTHFPSVSTRPCPSFITLTLSSKWLHIHPRGMPSTRLSSLQAPRLASRLWRQSVLRRRGAPPRLQPLGGSERDRGAVPTHGVSRMLKIELKIDAQDRSLLS